MKKFFASVILAVSAFTASAINPFVEFQPVIAGGGTTSFNFQAGITTGVLPNVSVGAGIGLTETWSFNAGPLIPIFVRGQYETSISALKPFVSFDLGYEANTEGGNGAVLVNPMVGLKFSRIYAGLGYLGHCWTDKGAGSTSCFNIKVGLNF